METLIDLVYVLGSGSNWNNNELRISLRSVEKNLSGYGKIFIVGENPGFLSDSVIHLPFPDKLSSQNADGNMALKILHACADARLSKQFLFMNDDFIINKPIAISEIQWMHKGDMKDHPEEFWKTQFYRHRLRRTFDILQKRGLPTLQYDYHAPMIMDKEQFPAVMEMFDFIEDIGYTFRSLYGNSLQLPAIPIDGKKVTLYKSYSVASIVEKTKDALFVGYNDNGLCPSSKYWMFSNFSNRCSFESNDSVNDRFADIASWIINGKDYNVGVEIYKKYHPNNNFTMMLCTYQTASLEAKLNFKLTQYINNL